MNKCDGCYSENFLLLTRQNPKGRKGIFHCEKCTGKLVANVGEALVTAVTGEDGCVDVMTCFVHVSQPLNIQLTLKKFRS